jgi:iron complex transport system substrate-binding protein
MKRMEKFGKLLAVLVLAIAIAACGQNPGTNGTANSSQPPAGNGGANQGTGDSGGGNASDPAGVGGSSQADRSKRTVYPLTVKDDSGKEFTFVKPPERIVSISPTETEILFALGLGDKIVGVSDYDDYPEEAKSKPKMGGLQGNVETILAASPDIVFAGISLKKDTVEKMAELKLPLFRTDPKTVDAAMERILLFGKITDTQEQAEKIVEQMKKEKQQVVEAVKQLKPEEKKKVYIEFSPGWTVGKGEFMDDMISLAGGINVAGDLEGWAQISEEKIIQANPDVILFSKYVPNLEQTIRGRGGWDKISAIAGGRVVGIDDNLMARPGPRITKGLIDIAKGIYPELVK